ncbi:hypothetical protein AO268_04095 [Pseudomonas sp. ICMP 8385]|nr:hypothetical protein AO268_04095 [Pseudomonas sp. ICMP 8385]
MSRDIAGDCVTARSYKGSRKTAILKLVPKQREEINRQNPARALHAGGFSETFGTEMSAPSR